MIISIVHHIVAQLLKLVFVLIKINWSFIVMIEIKLSDQKLYLLSSTVSPDGLGVTLTID